MADDTSTSPDEADPPGDQPSAPPPGQPQQLGLEDPPPMTGAVVALVTSLGAEDKDPPPALPVTMALPATLGRADQLLQLEQQHSADTQAREYEHESDIRAAELRHRTRMQRLVLGSIMLVLIVVFGLVLAAVWNHGITPEFGLDLGRQILPSLVGSAATIVGAMFISGGGSNSGGGGQKNS